MASLFYVRLGYNWARFDADEDVVVDTAGGALVASVSGSDHVTRGGFHYGCWY